jgi:methionine biosynthesis protein MetW
MPPHRYCLPDSSDALTDEIIREHIEPGSRVIDLGCGDGRLLSMLRDEHGCTVQGVELDRTGVIATITRGVPVIQADLDQGLPEFPEDSFDFAVLSSTLQQVRHPQEVLKEMLRIARRALVVVPNFGYWRVRLQVVLHGRAPVTSELPYEWYNTPNLHVLSMHDFRDMSETMNVRILKELPIIGARAVNRAWAANLRAASALYLIERGSAAGGSARSLEPGHLSGLP